MSEGGLTLQQWREGGAQDHQLIDQMADLQALIVIFRGLPVDPGILVLQSIAEVFLGVETFIFDLPAQAPGGAEHDDRGGGDFDVGQVNEAAAGDCSKRGTSKKPKRYPRAKTLPPLLAQVMRKLEIEVRIFQILSQMSE